MLQLVDVGLRPVEQYEPIVGSEVIAELRELATGLRGCKVAHINSTSYGGGVSELLRSVVPLYHALGIDADWLVISGTQEFFEVTKGLHNGLQGADLELTDKAKQTYLDHNEQLSQHLDNTYDLIVIHDAQPAAMLAYHGKRGARWVWRSHIDTSSPNRDTLDFLLPFIDQYEALVFTMDEFVPEALRDKRLAIIPPGIDPLSPKNMAVPDDLSKRIVEWSGIHLDQLLVTQVSRFDPWKDPLGVIRVYRRLREDFPQAQLALLGQMALDDPQGWEMYEQIIEETAADSEIHVLTNFTGVGNMEVNAFQSCSNVVMQKSIREGFGLVVSETLWKDTPVVAGRAGGIPMQMPEGTGGYLVDDEDSAVERLAELLKDPQNAQELAAAGRAHVRENFLITRLLRDELLLLESLPPAGNGAK
jgi:trehalose synthase